ncbi:hypothetical protein Nepgr_021786 [Nepenthes gracilis]|uniref:cellulase n=1 Tax=Nepenthes gracilis TaxID=150966 RepID=A0AAD3SZC2_NEPGR|nr:hypothetical protein Nepgr_021786 [Nepenthes gracilis]
MTMAKPFLRAFSSMKPRGGSGRSNNVKFRLPMALNNTMITWSIIEYGRQMAAHGELGHAIEAIKRGTDYFIKAHPEPNDLYGEVPFSSSPSF